MPLSLSLVLFAIGLLALTTTADSAAQPGNHEWPKQVYGNTNVRRQTRTTEKILREKRSVGLVCLENTLTGNSSTCPVQGCQCKLGYLPPDCCDRLICYSNCRAAVVGRCLSCLNGFLLPDCCVCEPGTIKINGICGVDFRLSSTSMYTVSEDDNFAELTIIKIPASTTENATVMFSTLDGTAQASFDYISQSFSVTFGPEESEKSVQVPIINDSFREHTELFAVELINSYSQYPSIIIAIIMISYSDCDCYCTIEGIPFGSDSNCTCHDGYFGNGFICPDDDECKNGMHDCDMNANCTNTKGSFECTCNNGFVRDGKTCISNSSENLVPCPCNSSGNCFPFEDNGAEMCGCFPGYKRHMDGEGNQICIDIDECDSNSYDCGNGTCVNILGSHVCTCPPGYVFNIDEQQCIDLDECIGGIHDCSDNANCFNTEGSYYCTCRDRFVGNGITCLNNSDCETLNCSQICVNTTGSLTCACHPGYYLNTVRECEDLDECKLQLHSCNIHAECKNTIGGYDCQCRSGYRGNGKICNDIDECITGLNDCPENSNCRNLDGNFSCGVRPIIEQQKPERPNHNLYYTVGIDFCLEDMGSVLPNMIMECSLGNKPDPPPEFAFTVERILLPNSTDSATEMLQMQMSNDSILQLNETTVLSLFNVDTKFIIVTCVISNTFGSANTSTTITICDPTECQDGVTNNCTQTCARIVSNGTSSYECGCGQGYELSLDNTTCDDIDECSMTCFESENRICSNTIGSYECDCKYGYQENKISQVCEDIDECQDRTLCLQSPLKYCVNIQGSYFCQCMAGYENSTSGVCIDVDECATNRHNCSDRMDCIDTMGSYVCVCKEGYNVSIGFEDECQDIDECVSNPCHPNATCTNENGTFTCECDAGYEGNGFTCQEIQPDGRSSDLDIVIISSTVGAVAFLLVVGIVVVLACICYYVRKSSDIINTKKESDVIDHTSPKDRNEYGEFHLDSLPRTISVQSSYKLDLPPYLLVHAADIKLMEPIGQGEFGIVYKGYLVKDQGSIVTDTVAIKTLKGLYDRSTVRDMLKECAKMYKFDHSNVLTLKGVCLDGGTAPYIIMPFMANGSLLAYLKKNRETLVVSQSDKDEDNVLAIRKQLMDWCIQVAKGMEYLASKKMVHRDLAARNCMIDMNFVIKVADFGLAESMETKEYFREDKSSHIKLPLRWLAPESMDDYVFSEKSDVWAYGVTCWEIFSGGKVPYGGVIVTDLSRRLADGYRLEKPNNDACNDQLYKFMLQCWEFEPVNRPRFANIVSALSTSLEALAGYVDIGAFGGSAMETSGKCGETFELKVEEQSMCPTSSEEKPQDEELIPDESTV